MGEGSPVAAPGVQGRTISIRSRNTFWLGLNLATSPEGTSEIARATSSPSTTLPNRVCLPLRWRAASRVTKKLASVGVRSRVGHPQHPRFAVPQLVGHLVRQRETRRTRPVAEGISGLDHVALDHAVEEDVSVQGIPIDGLPVGWIGPGASALGEADEARDRARGVGGEELHADHPRRRVQHRVQGQVRIDVHQLEDLPDRLAVHGSLAGVERALQLVDLILLGLGGLLQLSHPVLQLVSLLEQRGPAARDREGDEGYHPVGGDSHAWRPLLPSAHRFC